MKRSFLILLILLFPTSFFLRAIDHVDTVAAKERPHLLLITIDTLRSDRLSCYGSQHLKTPNIDRLANEGSVFLRAFAHTPTTLPSHTNILLGTTPLYHGVHDNTNFVVQDMFITLAEHLQEAGYATGAFIGAFPLDSRFGIAQGFSTYDDQFGTNKETQEEHVERTAGAAVDRALDWLKNRDSSWFLWLHCYDPHEPYAAPEPFGSRFRDNPYDGEVAYVDSEIGRLLTYLQENKVLSNTIVVFTGDHGEALGDHGEMEHGFFAYNEVMWIPLIITAPGNKHREIRHNVSHIDIFPTICELLEIKEPEFLQGISLVPAMKGRKPKLRAIYFESLQPFYNLGWAPIRGYLDGNNKFIQSPLPEYYDLAQDFSEATNLVTQQKLGDYQKKLDRLIKELSLESSAGAKRQLDKKTLEKLQTLGYISNLGSPGKEKFSREDDVKNLLPFHNRAAAALQLAGKGQTSKAIEMLKQVITEKNNIDLAYINLARLYKDSGRGNDAAAVLKMGLEHLPNNYKILFDLIGYTLEAGKFDEAIAIFEENQSQAADIDPFIWNYVGVAFIQIGNMDRALECFNKALSIDDEFSLTYKNLSRFFQNRLRQTRDIKDYQNMLKNILLAIKYDPDNPQLYNTLGLIYLQGNNPDKAIPGLEKALQLDPRQEETLLHLAVANMRIGNEDKAHDFFRRFKQTSYYKRMTAKNKADLENLIIRNKPRPKKK